MKVKVNYNYKIDNGIDAKSIVHTHTKFAEKPLGERLMYSNEFHVQIALYTKKSVSIDIIVDGMEYHIRQLEKLSCGGRYRCVGDDKRGYYFKMDRHQGMPDLCEVIYRIIYGATNGLDKTYDCDIVFDSVKTAEVCGMPVDRCVAICSSLENSNEDGQ